MGTRDQKTGHREMERRSESAQAALQSLQFHNYNKITIYYEMEQAAKESRVRTKSWAQSSRKRREQKCAPGQQNPKRIYTH